jgi:hypothetical protein
VIYMSKRTRPASYYVGIRECQERVIFIGNRDFDSTVATCRNVVHAFSLSAALGERTLVDALLERTTDKHRAADYVGLSGSSATSRIFCITSSERQYGSRGRSAVHHRIRVRTAWTAGNDKG